MCSGLSVPQQQTMMKYNQQTFLSKQTFLILIGKVNRSWWIFMTGTHMTVEYDACAHETSSLDITRNADFLLFVQKAAFFKAMRFKVLSALLFHQLSFPLTLSSHFSLFTSCRSDSVFFKKKFLIAPYFLNEFKSIWLRTQVPEGHC